MDPCFTAQLYIAHPHYLLSRSTRITATRFRFSQARHSCPTPRYPPPGAPGELLRTLARDMGHPLPDPPSFSEPSTDAPGGPSVAAQPWAAPAGQINPRLPLLSSTRQARTGTHHGLTTTLRWRATLPELPPLQQGLTILWSPHHGRSARHGRAARGPGVADERLDLGQNSRLSAGPPAEPTCPNSGAWWDS
jgi:hypothetical protein